MRLRAVAELVWDSCNISGLQLSKFPSAAAARDHKTLSNNGSLQEFLSQGGETQKKMAGEKYHSAAVRVQFIRLVD